MSPTGRAFTGLLSKAELEEIVVTSLKKAGLFEEVKDRLMAPGTASPAVSSSGCASPLYRSIPRSFSWTTLLGARPDRHRQDRGADRRAAADFCIVIVTHSMQQAARALRSPPFHLGNLVEVGIPTPFHKSAGKAYAGLHYRPVRLI
jgi:phosphate transport system ATP-binding protein